MAKKKIQIENTPISVQELKFWLKGISEFQPDNWVPTKIQWEAIKGKIFLLREISNNSNIRPPVVSDQGGNSGNSQTTFQDTNISTQPFVSTAVPALPQRDAAGFYVSPAGGVPSSGVLPIQGPASASGEPSTFL